MDIVTVSSKDPDEIITVTFDFSAIIATPQNASVSAHVHLGIDDPNIASMVDGAPTVSGAKVHQRIINGLNDVTYALRCIVDGEDGGRYVITMLLPIASI